MAALPTIEVAYVHIRVHGSCVRSYVSAEVSLTKIVILDEFLHVILHDVSMARYDLLLIDDGSDVLHRLCSFVLAITTTYHIII